MKVLLVIFALLPVPLGIAQEREPLSPAQVAIAQTQTKIGKGVKVASAYADLATAYVRRARETGDSGYYAKAKEAAAEVLVLDPKSFEAKKAQAGALLGEHEFAKALQVATEANRQAPDDLTVYGLLSEINRDLGNYAESEKAAQWILDLRPGNTTGLIQAAQLRELYGDVDGAFELMRSAYDATAPTETEERAWIFCQMGHLLFLEQRYSDAEAAFRRALDIFPEYHLALAGWGEVKVQEGKFDEAAALFQRRYERVPRPACLFDFAQALELAGRRQEASTAFEKFEQVAVKESNLADNANHELALYYDDHKHDSASALRVARLEASRRRDVDTLDRLAWALHSSGLKDQAREQISKALATGTRDPLIRKHGAAILGDTRADGVKPGSGK